MIQYFNQDEFKCKCGCGMDITDELKDKILQARIISDTQYVVNSGARCKEHNAKVGASPTSSHTKGLAVDIGYKDSLQMAKIVYGLSKAGFTRFGIHHKFVHVDIDRDKPNAFWKY